MLLGKSSSKTVPPTTLSEYFGSGTVTMQRVDSKNIQGGVSIGEARGWGWWRSRGATGGEPLPPLASAASRRVGPCTRSVVQRSCTGGPGAASASVTLGRRADSERSGPPPAPVSPSHANEQNVSLCYALGERSATSSGALRCVRRGLSIPAGLMPAA